MCASGRLSSLAVQLVHTTTLKVRKNGHNFRDSCDYIDRGILKQTNEQINHSINQHWYCILSAAFQFNKVYRNIQAHCLHYFDINYYY